jgi:hypothetical protein
MPSHPCDGSFLGTIGLLRTIGPAHVDVPFTVLILSGYAELPGVAAHLAVLNQCATDVGFEVNLDSFPAIRTGHDKHRVHEVYDAARQYSMPTITVEPSILAL